MSDSESYDNQSDDSDAELQRAFADGRLKQGLNIEVKPDKLVINNVSGMKAKLEEIRLNLDWVERLDLTSIPVPAATGMDVMGDGDIHNDFKREMKFYRQAQASVLEGISRLHAQGIHTKRPDDYFAQMAKSDDHMKKIREKLLAKQIGMERSEKAKKFRELRKYGKKVQHEVLQKRYKEKREMLDAIKKYRKGQKDKLDFLEDGKSSEKRKGKGKEPQKERNDQPNKKRQFRNEKFGFGGQKKRSKMNTKQSSADISGFNPKIHSTKIQRKGNKLQNQNKKRPGKARRQNIKNRKR